MRTINFNSKMKWNKRSKYSLGLLKKCITLMLVLISLQTTMKGQTVDRVRPIWWFGIAGAANFNFYNGTAQILNDNLTLPYAFENGFGVAPYVSIFAEYRKNRVWGLMFNVAYDGRMGQFSRIEGPSSPGTSLTGEFDYIAFEPSLRIAPFAGNLYFFIGPRFSYNVQDNFMLHSEPEYGSNNESKWSDVYGVRISAQVGVGYEIPLSAPDNTTQVNLSPFVAFLPYFGEQPRSIENLTLTTVRAGMAIKIGCVHRAEPATTSEITVPPPAPAPNIQFSVSAPSYVPSQQVVKETLPLSNYVFFDIGNTEIPSRYILLTKSQAVGFSEMQLQDCQKDPSTRSARQLTMYYNVMNIVADRMRIHPDVTITLIGASAGKGEAIARANATSVKNYLVNTFGIDPSRIKIEARNRPLIPSELSTSKIDTELTVAEDNRVDIVSNSPYLMTEVKDNSAPCLNPIEVTSLDGSSPGDAKVTVNATGASSSLRSWSLDVKDSAGNSQHFGPFTSDVTNLSGAAILNGSANGSYTIVMTGYTREGDSIKKSTSFTLSRQAVPSQQEQYLSILFEFDKSRTVATYTDFLATTVSPHIQNNSIVVIDGYTDNVGSADYNQTLSVQRAQEAQLILQAATSASNLKEVEYRTNGHGNVNAPFPNTLPEERFYNRTVVIDVIPNGSVAQK